MISGSIYAAIAWMRQPQVCMLQPEELADLIELEINARNDEIAGLRAEVGKLRAENEALKKVDLIGAISLWADQMRDSNKNPATSAGEKLFNQRAIDRTKSLLAGNK